jgi:uncharacterized protein YjbJ (UPF0337 family)
VTDLYGNDVNLPANANSCRQVLMSGTARTADGAQSYSAVVFPPRVVRGQGSQSESPSSGVLHMNKDQIKGTTKDLVGKVQEEAGKLIGSKEQQAKGLHKQISGKAQKAVGDVEQVIEDAAHKS